jgi:SOS regulatory protein LexA
VVSEMEFGEYFKQLRMNRHITINSLASMSGISASQISRIENGLRGIPKPDTLQKLSTALKVPYEQMLEAAGYLSITDDKMLELMVYNLVETPNHLKETVELVRSFHKKLYADLKILENDLIQTNDESKINKLTNDISTIKNQLFLMSNYSKFKKTREDDEGNSHFEPITSIEPYKSSEQTKLPVLGIIRAGEPIDRFENIEGFTLVDPDLLRGRDGFALRVKGDSMSGDRILEGDIVIILKQEEVNPSDIAVVAVNGDEATLKRVKLFGDMVMLSPSNTAYEPQLFPAKEVSIIGKVVEVKFWPK